MLSGRRSQTGVIEMFVFHLAAVLMGLAVVITLMGMNRDLQMSADQFQVETEFYAMFRRLVSNPDCLAYRKSQITYDEATGNVLTGREVFLGLIDEGKYNDDGPNGHFNCMKMDYIGSEGLNGSGLSVMYEVALYDLEEKEYLYTPVSSSGLPRNVYERAPMNHSKFSDISNDDVEAKGCKDASSSKREVFPTMIRRTNGDINPGFMYLKICSRQGLKHEGETFCEKEIDIDEEDIPGKYKDEQG